MSSIRGSASNLMQATKDLSAEWQQTKVHWRDAKSVEFEANYLEALPHHASRAALVIEELDALLRKVKKDCE